MIQPSMKKNFILSMTFQILCMITPLITAPYISRILEADGVGIYSYTASIQYYFSMFAALGTTTYGTREIARVRDNKEKRSKLFWEIELLTIVTTVVCVLFWGIMIYFQKHYTIYYFALTLNIVAVLFDISWFYTGLEQFQYIVYPNAIFKIIGIICVFIFVRSRNDLLYYILIMGCSTVLGNLAMWIYLQKFVTRIDLKQIKISSHFKETLVYFVPTVATSMYTVLDKTLIGWITKDDFQNGYYEQATKIINIAKTICFSALNNVLGARTAYLYAQNDFTEIQIKIKSSIEYISFIGLGTMFGLIGVASRFVPCFFGLGYDDVIYILWILSPISLIIGISNCLGSQFYTPAGLRSLSAKFLIIGAVFNLILNCLLIPFFKSYGAALASVAAELLITMLYVNHSNRILSWQYILGVLPKKLAGCFLMLGAILIINHYLTNNFVATVLDICIGGSIYMLLLIILQDNCWINIKNFILNKNKLNWRN